MKKLKAAAILISVAILTACNENNTGQNPTSISDNSEIETKGTVASKEILEETCSDEALPAASPEDFEYETLDDGTISITGYTGEGGAVIIPCTIDGKAVTKIKDGAFFDKLDSSPTTR